MQPIICDVESNCTYPPGLPFDSVRNLPEDIQKVYSECKPAFGSGCYTAAVILARTLLNHVAVDKGAEENKSFQFYVNYLVDNYMPKNAKGWVDTIRAFANASTHHLEILEQQDAEQAIKFVMYLRTRMFGITKKYWITSTLCRIARYCWMSGSACSNTAHPQPCITTTPSTKVCSIGRARVPRQRIRPQVSAISTMWSVAVRCCCLSVSLNLTV